MDANSQLGQLLRRLGAWVAANLGVRFFLAILLSIVVWGAITLDANPTAETVLREEIQVEAVGLPDNMVRVDELPKVQVAVRGPKTSLDLLDADSFVARVRLTSLGAGTHLVPVEAEVTDPSVEIQRVTPSELAVRLERKITSETPVRLVITGEPAQGFRARQDEISFDPERITVEGPEEAVKRVAFYEAKVNLAGATNNLSVQVAARPIDSAGEEVLGVLSASNLVDVVVPIERITARKSVPVRLQVVGVPASGRVATRYSSTPSNVEIQGEPELIDPAEQILAEPIDIGGTVDDVEAVAPLIVPSGIVLVRGEYSVQVRIDIDPIQNSTVFITGVLMRNLPPGMSATLRPTSVQVLVIGSADSLRELGPTDIRAEVDLSNRAPGTHQVQPTVLIPPGIDVASVVPRTVTLTLQLLPTPTPAPTPTPTPTADGESEPPDAELTRTPTSPAPTETPTPTPTQQAPSG